jgi:hypothetical protein
MTSLLELPAVAERRVGQWTFYMARFHRTFRNGWQVWSKLLGLLIGNGVKTKTRELQSLALIETLHYYILPPLPYISPSSLSVVFALLKMAYMALLLVSSERDSNAVAFPLDIRVFAGARSRAISF